MRPTEQLLKNLCRDFYEEKEKLFENYHDQFIILKEQNSYGESSIENLELLTVSALFSVKNRDGKNIVSELLEIMRLSENCNVKNARSLYLGIINFYAGKYENAKENLLHYVTEASDYFSANLLATSYYNIAISTEVEHLKGDDWQQLLKNAIKIRERFLKDPVNAESNKIELGKCCKALADKLEYNENAIQLYKRAIEYTKSIINPAPIYISLVHCYFALKDYKSAEEYLEFGLNAYAHCSECEDHEELYDLYVVLLNALMTKNILEASTLLKMLLQDSPVVLNTLDYCDIISSVNCNVYSPTTLPLYQELLDGTKLLLDTHNRITSVKASSMTNASVLALSAMLETLEPYHIRALYIDLIAISNETLAKFFDAIKHLNLDILSISCLRNSMITIPNDIPLGIINNTTTKDIYGVENAHKEFANAITRDIEAKKDNPYPGLGNFLTFSKQQILGIYSAFSFLEYKEAPNLTFPCLKLINYTALVELCCCCPDVPTEVLAIVLRKMDTTDQIIAKEHIIN